MEEAALAILTKIATETSLRYAIHLIVTADLVRLLSPLLCSAPPSRVSRLDGEAAQGEHGRRGGSQARLQHLLGHEALVSLPQGAPR